MPAIGITVVSVGGLRATIQMLWTYSNSQFQGSSAVFGATGRSAYKMFAAAVVWNLFGTVVWLWALPANWLRHWTVEQRRKAAFLSIVFLPSFLFSACIHIGDPDQGLASITILCVAGAGVLARFLQASGSGRVYAIAAAVMAAHAVCFFLPPTRLARAASYRAVAAVDRLGTNAITAIQDLRCEGPVTIVHYHSAVASRHLEYYFPDDYVIVLPSAPGESPLSFYRHDSLTVPEGIDGVQRPDSHRILLVAPDNIDPAIIANWRNYRGIYYRDVETNTTVIVGPHRILPATLR